VGVVYLAHDTKLDRSVAIKSLPAEVMANPKARSRFSREARLLASVNHPNIATIHEVLEEAEGVGYLVLEYVPGQTLAERIAQARLKPQEALSIAQQIAEAVAAAHERDVIHRDLKPGNIKITPEGKVKVLDFGLAKAVGSEAAEQQSTVTEPGRVIGTPAYMSPEQARGQATDKRADIWSFGCVLYEMLTGQIPFKGETVSDTLANILQTEPEWHALPQNTPARIRILLRRCLEKDPRRRLRDVGDASIEIGETLSGTSEAFALPGDVAVVSRLFRRDVILACLACSIAGVLVAGAIFMSLVRPTPPGPPVVSRLSIPVPADNPVCTIPSPSCSLAISPDGTHLVYVGKLDDGNTELCMRSTDSLEVKPIPGTRKARNPFFSPCGQWVGFFTTEEERLKKVSLAGGAPVTLGEGIPYGRIAFGSWADDGTIVFAAGHGLQRISDDGGQPETLLAPAPESRSVPYRYPQVLPGGNGILYAKDSRIEVLEPETDKPGTVVLENARYAAYVRSGHLIFLRDNVLVAAPFDVEQLKITGPWAPLLDDVKFDANRWTPHMTVSRNGTLVYVLGSELLKGELFWVDHQGVFNSIGAPARVYGSPRLSPDGQRIAVTVWSREKNTSQVYVYDIPSGRLTPVTTEGKNVWPLWSPDGTRIVFSSSRLDGSSVFCKAVDGSAPAEPLASVPPPFRYLIPYSWSRDAEFLGCIAKGPNTQDDIWIVPIDGDRKPQHFLKTQCREYNPTLSPDGRWLAYVSDESGRAEVYLLRYPDRGRKIQVSTEGGKGPVWSRDGRELYYTNGSKMMAVEVTPEPDSGPGASQQLFDESYKTAGNNGRSYDVADDGRFLMVKTSQEDVSPGEFIVVHNWFEELKRLAPPGKK
jgi:serine/threonine-protein kinase